MARLVNQFFGLVAAHCACFLPAWTAGGAVRFGTRSFEIESVAPSVEFFLPSQSSCFSQGTGNRSALLRCTGRSGRRWSTSGGTSAGAWRVWDKHRGGCSLGDGRGRCAPLDADGARHFPLREKERPHSTCTHPQRARSAHTHDRASCASRHVRCHVHMCSLWRCGLVSACE